MQNTDEFVNALAIKLADVLADKVAEKLATAKRYLSPAQYAASRSLGERTVYRAIANGKLPHKRSGTRVLISPEADISN